MQYFVELDMTELTWVARLKKEKLSGIKGPWLSNFFFRMNLFGSGCLHLAQLQSSGQIAVQNTL